MEKEFIEYRHAIAADVGAIVKMGNTFQTFPLPEEVLEWIADLRHAVVVAVEMEQIIGFAIGIRQSQSWMMLESLYINPEKRKDGVGRRLYGCFLMWLPKEVNFLTTFVNDPTAIKVALRNGFIEHPSLKLLTKEW